MPLTTDQVRQLASQGPLSTSQVQTLATPPVSTTPTTPTNPTITAASLAPQTPIQPVITEESPLPDASLQSQIDVINQQYATPLPNDSAIKTERSNISDIITQLYGGEGEQATRSKLEADPAVEAKRQQVLDLSSRAQALQNEQLAIPLQIQQDAQAGGANVTKGGLQPIQTAALRNNAIQSLSVGSLLSAAQGNLSLALNQVDRAVKAQFEPLRNELEARKANLELLMSDPNITREQNRRAEIAKLSLAFQESQIQKQETNKKSVLDLAAKLGSFGVDNDILTKVQDAKTFDEAMRIAGPYLQDPASKQTLANAKLDYDMKLADIAYKRRQTELLGQPKEATAKKLEEAKTNAKVAVSVANDQVAVIDGLLNHPGMQYAVGPYSAQREGMFAGIPGIFGVGESIPAMINKGKTQEFVGAVGQLISTETMNTLLNLKKSGGTLGALSDSERIMLRNAASKIGAWEIEDPKTKQIVGYGVDEESFKRELRVLQALAKKAATESAGVSLGEDSAEIDALLGLDNVSDEELAAYLQ